MLAFNSTLTRLMSLANPTANKVTYSFFKTERVRLDFIALI